MCPIEPNCPTSKEDYHRANSKYCSRVFLLVVVPTAFKVHQFKSCSKILIAPNGLKIKAATEQALSTWTATCQRKLEMLVANA